MSEVKKHRLRRFDGKTVSLTAIDGNIFEGICEYNSRDYNYHEFGYDEDGLQMVNFLFINSNIVKIKSLEDVEGPYGHFSAPYGTLEEMNLTDDIDLLEDWYDEGDDIEVFRMLNCLEDHLVRNDRKREIIDVLRKLHKVNASPAVKARIADILYPVDYYAQIFRRKSFHIFKDTGEISDEDLRELKLFITTVTPLYPEIRTEITVVPQSETTCKRGRQYCITFYSEPKEGYLRNIGYIGEQIDLYLTQHNIGALWFGIGKPEEPSPQGMEYVIMIAISAMAEDKFRKDMFKAKRKSLEEIWSGDTLNVAEIVRFTPSACNTQPWITENNGNELTVYRYKKPGKRGIMPAAAVQFYNRIDMGIYLFMLETCLKHEGYRFERTLFEDDGSENEKTLTAKYQIKKA